MNKLVLRSLLLVLPLCWALQATAEIYRWVDDKGQVHYSDRPNPEVNQAAVQVDVDEASSGGKYVVPEEDPNNESPEAAVNRTRAEQCDLARERLGQYRNASTVVRRDETGEETEISPEEKVQLIVKTEQQVKSLCTESEDTASN